MKKIHFSILLALILSIFGTKSFAYSIAVENADGVTIYYNDINDGELEVTQGNYSGSVNIPESVTYMSQTRKVTSIGYKAFYNCIDLTSVTIPNSVTYIADEAFSGCRGLTSITIPDGVTSIGTSIFSNCKSLTSVTIPNSVTSIANYAFENCIGLTSLTIPNSVTSIGYKAFYSCIGLTSVTIPNSVTSIGRLAFWGCSGLTSVTIPNSVTSIEYMAFSFCSGLTTVIIPNSVTSIGNGAFKGCTSLISVTIPNSVMSIEAVAFSGCRGLTSITFPDGVTSIGGSAFLGCSGLTTVTIPNSVTSIGNYAFSGCSGLSTVTIPYGVTSIGSGVFSSCSGLTSVTIPNSVTSIGDEAFSGCSGLTTVTIPNSVTSIGNRAFDDCSGLTSITIPDGVTSIGESAFAWCSGLNTVVVKAETPPFLYDNSFTFFSVPLKVPKGCKKAYQTAQGWKNFTNISDADKYKLIYMVDNEEYKSYEIEEGSSITPEAAPTKIGYTFNGWSEIPETMPAHDVTVTGTFSINKYKLTYVVDGETYKTYDVEYGASITPEAEPKKNGYTFSGWSDIPQTMPAHDLTVTGTFTFTGGTANGVEINGIYYNLKGNTKQAEVTQNPNKYSGIIIIPATVTYYNVEFSVTVIEPRAFKGCSSLTSVTIPNSITVIGFEAFSGCSSLTSIIIPDDVTGIGYCAFYDCSRLATINIPNNVTFIGRDAFSGCSGLMSVHILDLEAWCKISFSNYDSNPLSYAHHLFLNGEEIKDLVIPNSVTNIGSFAFYGCSDFTSVTIPQSITSIGKKVFASCQNLTDVYCNAENVPNTESNAFEDSYPETITLHVPAAAVNSYKATAPWSSFKKVIGIGATFTLTYKIDGQVYKTYELAVGEDITPEAEPTKEGYTFSGWSDIPQTMPDHDITVTGTFTVNKYKLTYMVDGKEYKSYDINYGSTITPEAEPTKEGYTFSGWSEIPETMPAKDVTVTGTFSVNKYKLTYVVDGETYKTYDVEYGASITPEAEPTKDGCTFSGWSDIPQTMPAHDVTVTGTFSVSKYKLIYKVDGEVYKTYELKYGSTITPEAEPTKEGHTFSGWSDIPETMPAHDVTVTGTFSVNKYRLTYLVDDKEYKSYEVEYGASITPEAEPTKKGHTFSGWSDIPNTMPARDVTVTGSFTINKYKLTYMVDDAVYKSYDIRYGSTITPEAEPTKNGYKFSGWSDIPEEMPDYDVTVYGYFEKVYDVADVVSLVNIIMNLTTASSEDISAYDMNHDNDLDIGDMILVIKEILRSQQTRVRGQEQGALTRAADPYVDLAQFTAAQFTVSVPTECAIEDIRLTGSNRKTHAVVWEQIGAGLYAVVVYSDSNLKFSAENGNILEVILSDKNCTDMATGNVVLATPEGERVWLNSLPAYAVTTGIANVRNTEAFDVYDLSGRKVRSKSHSLEGISSGVYIINGKKTVIK